MTGGTIASGQGTASVSVTLGSVGDCVAKVTATNKTGSGTGSETVTITARKRAARKASE